MVNYFKFIKNKNNFIKKLIKIIKNTDKICGGLNWALSFLLFVLNGLILIVHLQALTSPLSTTASTTPLPPLPPPNLVVRYELAQIFIYSSSSYEVRVIDLQNSPKFG
jgi:hypothetical protein